MYLSGPGRCAAFLSELHRPPFANAAAGAVRLTLSGCGPTEETVAYFAAGYHAFPAELYFDVAAS